MLSFRQMPRSVLLELLERLVVLLVKTIRFPAVVTIKGIQLFNQSIVFLAQLAVFAVFSFAASE